MIRNYEMKYLRDEFNEFGTRNKKNVERWQYNCGGFALGTYNWICPYDTEEEGEEYIDFDYWADDSDEVDFNERAEYTAEWMLNNIPGLRRVDSPDAKLEDGEWLIGYKVGRGPSWDGDFHFIKQTPSGRFYHKPGGNTIRRMGKAEALSSSWSDGAYTSKTIWLARKLNK